MNRDRVRFRQPPRPSRRRRRRRPSDLGRNRTTCRWRQRRISRILGLNNAMANAKRGRSRPSSFSPSSWYSYPSRGNPALFHQPCIVAICVSEGNFFVKNKFAALKKLCHFKNSLPLQKSPANSKISYHLVKLGQLAGRNGQ